jgi:3-dehydroquinate synthase
MQIESSNLSIQWGARAQLAEQIDLSRYARCALVSDTSVSTLYGQGILDQLPNNTPLFTLPPGEKAKTLQEAERLWEQMYAAQLPRSTLMIAFGGGALCDLANFAAGCYMRGVDVALVPTTLLSMVDAAIGGKCGVNLGGGKSTIGLIRQPKRVIVDPSLLPELPPEELRSGMAEVIKAGIIGDPTLFSLLESSAGSISRCYPPLLTEIISRSIDVKMNIVDQDEREELGIRPLLNLGHTFGHAIESASGWGAMRHGEAISIGMVCAAELSSREGYLPSDVRERIEKLCFSFGLPTRIPPALSASQLIRLMRQDKKNLNSDITYILIREIGSVFTNNKIPDCKIKSILVDLGANPT